MVKNEVENFIAKLKVRAHEKQLYNFLEESQRVSLDRNFNQSRVFRQNYRLTLNSILKVKDILLHASFTHLHHFVFIAL